MSKKNDKVLLEFPVMWVCWEFDSKALVMERPDGTRYIRMTNHGSPYKANPAELRERISEYESVLEQTRNALELLALSSEAAVQSQKGGA